MDAVQQLAQPCESLLERFHVDTRYIAAGAASEWKGGIVQRVRGGKLWHDLTDEFGVTWSMPDEQLLFMDISHHPLGNATIADVKDYPWPKGDDPGRFAGLRDRALMIRRDTPYAVISGISGVVYEICWYMRGLEQWLCDLLTDPEFCEAVIDRTLKFWLDWFRVFLDEVGDIVDVIMIGDDLAGQTGPLFHPEIYRRLVQPRHKRSVQYIRSRTKAKIWYHTCGACQSFLPELIDDGIDILNPVQTSARNMDARKLKGKYGDRLAFWAAVAIRSTSSRPRRRNRWRRMCAGMWRSSSPGAGTSSTTSTTSRAASHRKTLSRSMTPPTSADFTTEGALPRQDFDAVVRLPRLPVRAGSFTDHSSPPFPILMISSI